MRTLRSFHNLADEKVRPYQNYNGKTWEPGASPKVVGYDLRSVHYQFEPHFHPYVANLIQNLNNGDIAGLLATDTIYVPDTPSRPKSDKPFTVAPDSTRATLLAALELKSSNGTSVKLPAGTALILPDGASVIIPNPTAVLFPNGTAGTLTTTPTVSLPGQIPVSTSSGIQWKIGATETVIPDGTKVILSGAVKATFGSNQSSVTLPDKTPVSIRNGQPLAYLFDRIFGAAAYGVTSAVKKPYPVKDLDFTLDGAYSIYNWELFFHAPLLIAIHLSENQQFQDAQTWFHYIFNPTDNGDGPTPQRFWRVQPFQNTNVEMIQQILVNLSTKADPELRDQTTLSIDQWKNNPFQPWAVAQFRPTAYMLKTVMAYLDNLIAWGDSLFQLYTIETINEATQLYVLAANILGPKPQAVPVKASAKPVTYSQLRGKLNAFGDTLADLEADMPFDSAPLPTHSAKRRGDQILPSIGQSLYFCVPQNDRLLGYWDTVANRLFNIHNSLNLQGVFQQLPLYDPPIDPALLVRAAADGLDVSAIASGLNQPLPLVRFRVLVAKAMEICQEVKSLGANLLAAMEKQDNESLSLLRSQHESAVLKLAEMVKYSQWQDAQKATQALQLSLANATQRYSYYQKLLGRTDAQIQSSIPKLDGLDTGGLQNLNFTQSESSSEPQMAMDPITPDISQDSTSVSDGELNTLTNHEVEELNDLSKAHTYQETSAGINALGAILAFLPIFGAHVQPMGCGAVVHFGGTNLALNSDALAAGAKAIADQYSYEAANASKLGSYGRRELEWTFQSNSAKGEMNQVTKQLRSAQIREAIARKEYTNHQAQMANAQQIVDFLQGNAIGGSIQVKETTTGFYAWMKREVKALYANAFQLAFEVAKKAERAIQNELGDPSLAYIQYNYLNGNEGLLAGEKLMFDLKTMEMAYHDLNQREYEMTKHVSLVQAAPLALIQLRATGTCLVTLPEELFDFDCPGHYFRRIKSVALTIPCVTGPYTSVNCTLSLQKSSIRTKTDVANGYARTGVNDLRFDDYYGAMQTIVTSSAQSDSGLFETNLNDERYLPFEAVGIAGSQWQLTLPADLPQFNYDTISDIVLHVRYTAREGGESMRMAAVKNLQSEISKAQTIGSVRMFSVRHEFPVEWAKFKSATAPTAAAPAALSLQLLPQHYPYWFQSVSNAAIQQIELFAEMSDKATSVVVSTQPPAPAPDKLSLNPAYGSLVCGPLVNGVKTITQPTGAMNLLLSDSAMNNLWLAIVWKGKSPAA